MIYVVGSLNMDIAATVDRIPRAGETLAAQSVLVGCGGKGANQASAIGKLGEKCTMIGKVGNDAYGAQLIENLRGYGVRTDFVTTAQAPSGTAMIWVHKGNNRIVLHKGANDLLTQKDVQDGLADAKAGDILMLQLEVPLSVADYALKVGRRKGMITVLNPTPAVAMPQSMYENSEILTPNETETELLTGIKPDCEVNIVLALKKFRDMGAGAVIITLGKIGSAVAVGKEITLLPAYKVKAVDTTAAGDTFVGAVAVRLARGDTLVQAAQFAAAASALKVTRKGAAEAIPTIAEVEEFVMRNI